MYAVFEDLSARVAVQLRQLDEVITKDASRSDERSAPRTPGPDVSS